MYQNLVKRGFEVRYVPDQDVAVNKGNDEQQSVKYSISTSSWHRVKDLKTYVKPNDASVVVVSSLTNADEVKDLMENYGKDITFILIELSESFKNQNIVDWVQWLFIQNQKDDIDVYKRSWAISPLRNKLKENEKKLTAIIDKYQEAGMEIG